MSDLNTIPRLPAISCNYNPRPCFLFLIFSSLVRVKRIAELVVVVILSIVFLIVGL